MAASVALRVVAMVLFTGALVGTYMQFTDAEEAMEEEEETTDSAKRTAGPTEGGARSP